MKNTIQCIPKHAKWLHTVLLTASLLVQTATAQTTAFTFQGKLTDAGNPANGNYDLQFRLFDALVSGNQVGTTVLREDVSVTNGVFNTVLDFGAAVFPGANRFLEIAVHLSQFHNTLLAASPDRPAAASAQNDLRLNNNSCVPGSHASGNKIIFRFNNADRFP